MESALYRYIRASVLISNKKMALNKESISFLIDVATENRDSLFLEPLTSMYQSLKLRSHSNETITA